MCFGPIIPFDPFVPRDGPVPGEEPPQDPTTPTATPPTDCHRFAAIVDQIAESQQVYHTRPDDLSGSVQRFMNALATRFTEFASATRYGIAKGTFFGSDTLNAGEFGSTGFQPPYFEQDFRRDDGRMIPMNQVRHAVGGLVAGYVWGRDGGLAEMNSRENPADQVHGGPRHEPEWSNRTDGCKDCWCGWRFMGS